MGNYRNMQDPEKWKDITFNKQHNRCYGPDKSLIGNKLKIPYYAYPRREGKKQRQNQTKTK